MPTTSRSSTTTERGAVMGSERLAPTHPGEVLSEEFLKPLALSQNRVAVAIGVPPRRINEIVLGKRRITADTALRLASYFETSAQFWMGLQTDYDLDVAADRLADWLADNSRVHAKAV
jgi:addiction module HigA family antidote